MEDLRKRADSLSPPYPAFDEFVRALFEDGLTARVIGEIIISKGRPITEETVNAWSSGGSPGKQLYLLIKKELGYDFGERIFFEVASSNNFPPEDSTPEIRAIRSMRLLREHLSLALKFVKITALTHFCSLSSASILAGFIDGQGLSAEMLTRVLRAVVQLPRHLSGEFLSTITPMPIIAMVLQECRQKRGMGRKEYAQYLRIKKIDSDFLAYLEHLQGRPIERSNPKSGYTSDPERLQALCDKLMSERDHLESASEVVEVSEETRGSGVTETRESEDRAGTSVVKKGLEARVAELEKLVATLALRVSRLETGAATEVAPRTEEYRAPFGEGEWIEHDQSIDDDHLRKTQHLIEALCDELGFLARVRDKKKRARIREILRDRLTVELLGALEAFTSEEPSATKKIIESWRRAAREGLGIKS